MKIAARILQALERDEVFYPLQILIIPALVFLAAMTFR